MSVDSRAHAIGVFVYVYFFWWVGGIAMYFVRRADYSSGAIFDYAGIERFYQVNYDYLIFIIAILAAFKFWRVKPGREYFAKKAEISGALSLLVLFALYKLQAYGLLIFSNDYFSRFNVDANLIQNAFPNVFLIIALAFISRREVVSKNHLAMILFCVVLLSMTGSRTPLFIATMYLLIYYPRLRISARLSFVHFALILLMLSQFGGLLYNYVRWGGETSLVSIITLVSDLFPEFRHSVIAEYRLARLNTVEFGGFDWFKNFIAYYLPGFVYTGLGFDRAVYFNSIWNNFFVELIWANPSDAQYGVRVGLIGETRAVFGSVGVVVIGVLYGVIIRTSRDIVSSLLCLLYTIPYGLTGLYLLFYVWGFSFILSLKGRQGKSW